MNTLSRAIVVLAASFIAGIPMTAYAVSYPILEHQPQQVEGETVMKVGTIVYLFHSGTEDVKKTIGINDVLTVYREYPCCILNEAGKIKVLSHAGNNYMKAEVVEGEIKPGDIAKKGTVSCLVIVFGCTCK